MKTKNSTQQPTHKNTEIIVITDRSGSMNPIAKDAIGGFQTFIDEQKAIPGECRITSIVFDSVADTQYVGVDIKDVPALELIPRGGTALYDTLGAVLPVQNDRINKNKWAHVKICVIITDGEDNFSTEFTRDKVKTMITEYQNDGWKFVFLAANQDAFAAGASLGVAAAGINNFVVTSEGTAAMYRNLSSTTASFRA